jgi:hypothetical protein
MGELACDFEPVDEVEVEVMPAGAAAKDERNDGNERGYRKKDVRRAIARHEIQGKAERGTGKGFFVSLRRTISNAVFDL